MALATYFEIFNVVFVNVLNMLSDSFHLFHVHGCLIHFHFGDMTLRLLKVFVVTFFLNVVVNCDILLNFIFLSETARIEFKFLMIFLTSMSGVLFLVPLTGSFVVLFIVCKY